MIVVFFHGLNVLEECSLNIKRDLMGGVNDYWKLTRIGEMWRCAVTGCVSRCVLTAPVGQHCRTKVDMVD